MEITLVNAAIILVGTPVVVFLCVKVGTYAFYKGRQNFLDEEKQDGDKS